MNTIFPPLCPYPPCLGAHREYASQVYPPLCSLTSPTPFSSVSPPHSTLPPSFFFVLPLQHHCPHVFFLRSPTCPSPLSFPLSRISPPQLPPTMIKPRICPFLCQTRQTHFSDFRNVRPKCSFHYFLTTDAIRPVQTA